MTIIPHQHPPNKEYTYCYPKGAGVSIECLPYIISAHEETGIPYKVLIGLINYESGFNAKAFHRNVDGSIDEGYGQFNSEHIESYSVQYNTRVETSSFPWLDCSPVKVVTKRIDPSDPASILIIARILKDRYKLFHNNWHLAVASWHQGVFGVKRDGIDKYYDREVFK